MALAGWSKKCEITIAANKMNKTVNNQVMVLSYKGGHFPDGMVTSGGADACKSDGGDIRFSSDSDGNNLLAFDIMNISLNANPSNSNLIVFVRYNVTANASFSIYCHWGNAGAERPANNSSIGSGECWTNCYGVLYMQEDPADYTTTEGKWKAIKEATGRFSAGSILGSPTQVSGPISGMTGISIDNTNGIQIPEVTRTDRGGFQLAMYCQGGSTGGLSGAIYHRGAASQMIGFNGGKFKWQYGETWGNTNFATGNTWKLLTATLSGTTVTATYGNVDSTTTLNSATTLQDLQYIGGADTGDSVKNFDGNVALMMINQFTVVNKNFFRNLELCFNNINSLATAGTIQSSSSSSSLEITGLIDGTEVRVYDMNNSFNELGGVESASGGTFSLPYSGVYSVNIVILLPGYEYEIFTNLTLPSGGITIPMQQESDIWYDSLYPSDLNATNVIIDDTNSTIEVLVNFEMKELYAYLMDTWKATNSLFDNVFPLNPITDEQFVMRHPWDWKDDATRGNIRGAGYQRLNSDGSIAEKWMCIKTLGSLEVSNYAHFVQIDNGTSTWSDDFLQVDTNSSIERVIKIYGDSNNGNFDYSNHFVIFYRNLGQEYVQYDLVTEQGIDELTYRKYAIPLDSDTDISATETNPTNLDNVPYSNITISYSATNVSKIVNSVSYNFRIIIDGAGLTLKQIYDRVRFLQNRSRFQNMYDTGAGESGSGRTEENLHLEYVGQVLYTTPGVFIENFAGSDLNNVVFKDVTGTEVSYPLSVSFELTGLVPNSEVRIYRSSDMSEIAGVEDSTTSFSYTYEYTSDIPVYVVIHNVGYEYININTTLTASSTSIPIQQRFDRVSN